MLRCNGAPAELGVLFAHARPMHYVIVCTIINVIVDMINAHTEVLRPADHLVVLGSHHVGILGEVELQADLVCAQIGHMEQQAVMDTASVPPNDPAHSWIHQAIPAHNGMNAVISC